MIKECEKLIGWAKDNKDFLNFVKEHKHGTLHKIPFEHIQYDLLKQAERWKKSIVQEEYIGIYEDQIYYTHRMLKEYPYFGYFYHEKFKFVFHDYLQGVFIYET